MDGIMAGVFVVFTHLGGLLFLGSWALLVLGFGESDREFCSFVCLDSRRCFIPKLLVSFVNVARAYVLWKPLCGMLGRDIRGMSYVYFVPVANRAGRGGVDRGGSEAVR